MLPAHCDPISPFLESLSSLSHGCVPTAAACTSTFFGSGSVGVWVLLLLPQLIKNYRMKSTEGLYVFPGMLFDHILNFSC